MSMVIGFDAKRAFRNNTGLGNYSRMLVCSLASSHQDVQSILYAPQMSGYYNERVVWACLLIGLAVGVLSQLGDLLASGIKRDRGIKDYGTLIPGHGGIMDRFDSVLFVSPVVYFLIVFLLLPKGA